MFIEGVWQTVIHKSDGSSFALAKERNVFVIGIAKAISYMIINDTTSIFHAFGEGDALWDTNPPSPADVFEKKLINEFHRINPDFKYFVKYGSGKAQSGTTNTIVDPRRIDGGKLVGRVEENGFFVGQTINITAGTNFGLSRTITAYSQTTGTIEVNTPFPAPIDSTSEYEIPAIAVSAPSNSIQFRTILPFGTGSDSFNNKYIREEAIFLGDATSTKDSGFMINAIRHPKIWKDTSIQLERIVTLTFRI